MEQIKNVVKIKGNKNQVSQGTGDSSKAYIEGNKNKVNQVIFTSTSSTKTSKWTKFQIISAFILASLTLLSTYIINKDKIDSWVSSLF